MSLARAIVEVASLTTATIFCPLALAARRHAKVSAVSPDCETRMVNPPGWSGGAGERKNGGDFDSDGKPRKSLEPIFGGEPRDIGRAASANRQALEGNEIDGRREGQRRAAGRHVEIMPQRAGDDLRLLVDFLGHEMAIIALVDQRGRGCQLDLSPLSQLAFGIVKPRGRMGQDDGVAILQIGDRASEGAQGKRIGAKKHFAGMFAFAKSYRERRAAAGADQKILLAVEDQGERESTLQAREARSHGLDRRPATPHGFAHEMGDNLGIGLGRKFMALGLQFTAQLPKILDNAIMHDTDIRADVRMRVIFAWPSMRCPAGMANADPAQKGFGG